MFFALSKILGFFALPSNLVVFVGVLGLVLWPTRLRRLGRAMAIGSLLLVAVLGWSPLGNALILPLEQRFPPWQAGQGEISGIVVLGGGISPDVSTARHEVVLNEAGERLTEAAVLARRYPDAKIIYSGGDSGLILTYGIESEQALRLFRELGIAPERLISEDRSRNTVENAVFSRELAAPKPGERWLLVTSAYHMPRSIGVFRRAGFSVEAFPVDWRTRGWIDAWRPFLSIGDGLRRTDTAVREWVGLLIYWVTGKSSALFPGPAADT